MELWQRTDLNRFFSKRYKPLLYAFLLGSLQVTALFAGADEEQSKKDATHWTAQSLQMPNSYRSAGAKYAKIRGSKVRMRQKPTLDSPIIRQMQNGEALFVGNEVEGFTEIFPSIGQKAYVFRTYILDNQVEGKKVNVRLAPSLKAPIVAQLSQGDKVEGQVCSSSRKWLEIDMPLSARFYIYSKYLELITEQEYQSIATKAESALPKNDLAVASANRENSDTFKTSQKTAQNTSQKTAQAAFQETSRETLKETQKAASKKNDTSLISSNSQPARSGRSDISDVASSVASSASSNGTSWNEIENQYFETWKQSHPSSTISDYEQSQILAAHEKSGLLTPYDSKVQNPPGDYLLELSSGGKIFLYSHKIDLSAYVGQQVRLLVLKRTSADFAWPAFVVVDIQDIDHSSN